MDKYQKQQITVGGFLLVFVLLLGFVTFALSIKVLYRPLAFRLDSNTVTGTVMESSVEHYTRGRPWTQGYGPEVTYRYRYEGETYTNDAVTPGSIYRYEYESEASAVADQYTPAEEVTVFLRPENPEDSALMLAFPRFMGLGLPFLVSLLFTLLLGTALVKVVKGEVTFDED